MIFEALKFEYLMTIFVTGGCCVSKTFAACVVAGAIGVFAACAFVLLQRGARPYV